MKRILLAGATGHLGRHFLSLLKLHGYQVTALVRTCEKATSLSIAPDEIFYADATRPKELRGCCLGIDVVVSALGKSISLSDRSKASFHDIDYQANYNLLQKAKAAGVKQFVYISAFSAEEHPQLAYFRAHADFSRELIQSGLIYSILQPTALFSAFDELAAMARRGRLGVIGDGSKRTNPIHEADVAKVVVQSIGKSSAVIPLGGKQVYTRLEIARIVGAAAGYYGSVFHVPKVAVALLLPMMKHIDTSLYHKAAFLAKVSTQDCVAPQVGEQTLEGYFKLAQEKSTAQA